MRRYRDDEGHEDWSGKKTLGKLLREQPRLYQESTSRQKGGVIRCARLGLQVVNVSELHPRYLHITELYLHSNSIQSLQWATAFQQLQVLALSDNLIDSWHQVSHLSRIATLQKLSLQGNPIYRKPFIKSHLRLTLPQVEYLDGLKVMPREIAKKDITLETSWLAMLMDQYCTVHTLSFGLRLCKVHAELCKKTIRYPSIPNAPLETRRRHRFVQRGKESSWFVKSGRQVVEDAQQRPLSSSRLSRLLDLWRFQETMGPAMHAEFQEDLIKMVLRTSAAKKAFVLAARGLQLPSTKGGQWEVEAFAELLASIEQDVNKLLLVWDEQLVQDSWQIENQPRIGENVATRRYAELEAARALRWDADRESVIHDLIETIDAIRANDFEIDPRMSSAISSGSEELLSSSSFLLLQDPDTL